MNRVHKNPAKKYPSLAFPRFSPPCSLSPSLTCCLPLYFPSCPFPLSSFPSVCGLPSSLYITSLLSLFFSSLSVESTSLTTTCLPLYFLSSFFSLFSLILFFLPNFTFHSLLSHYSLGHDSLPSSLYLLYSFFFPRPPLSIVYVISLSLHSLLSPASSPLYSLHLFPFLLLPFSSSLSPRFLLAPIPI